VTSTSLRAASSTSTVGQHADAAGASDVTQEQSHERGNEPAPEPAPTPEPELGLTAVLGQLSKTDLTQLAARAPGPEDGRGGASGAVRLQPPGPELPEGPPRPSGIQFGTQFGPPIFGRRSPPRRAADETAYRAAMAYQKRVDGDRSRGRQSRSTARVPNLVASFVSDSPRRTVGCRAALEWLGRWRPGPGLLSESAIINGPPDKPKGNIHRVDPEFGPTAGL
jgi:hypothetical protein